MKQLPIFRLLAVATMLLLFGVSSVCADWYHPSWISRRAITIDNFNNNCSLFDFQVGVEIPCYAMMQQDFSDIRFTSDDGITEIPYWVEEYTHGENATVWIRVPYIPAMGFAEIYLYYANFSAESASNGVEVFDYFDDFNDQDISDWTVICGEWTAQNKYLEQMLTANHRKILSPYSFDGPPAGIVAEAKMNYMSGYYASGQCIFFSDDWYASGGYRFGFHGLNGDGTAIDKIYQWLDSDPTIYTGNYGYTWLKGRVTYDGAGNFTFLLRAPDGVFVFLEASDTEYTAPFVLGNYCGSHTGLDDFRVRKYSDWQPACVIGAEERRFLKDVKSLVCSITPPISDRMVIRLMLPSSALVSGSIYDCAGRRIATLVEKQYFTGGEHAIAMKKGLRQMSNGTYFIRMTIEEPGKNTRVLSEKMLLIR